MLAQVAQEELLHCIMIPLSGGTGRRLLLPNVCVAEVVASARIEVDAAGPAWLIGRVGWRGVTVPVVDFGRLEDPDAEPVTPRCLVVMNRSRLAGGPGFYALAGPSVPRLMQLSGQDLASARRPLSPLDVMNVQVGTEIASIPDLDCVERNVAEVLSQSAPQG